MMDTPLTKMYSYSVQCMTDPALQQGLGTLNAGAKLGILRYLGTRQYVLPDLSTGSSQKNKLSALDSERSNISQHEYHETC